MAKKAAFLKAIAAQDAGVNHNSRYCLGDRVMAKYKGAGTYPATITACNEDGSYAVLYDDGDKDLHVGVRSIRCRTCLDSLKEEVVHDDGDTEAHSTIQCRPKKSARTSKHKECVVRHVYEQEIFLPDA